MTFIKVVENFVCEHCGHEVKGSGYTNHCPRCLWSKHVDVSPGDRAALCGGLMEPIAIEGTSPEYMIVHRCTRCGNERRNVTAENDEPSALIAVAEGGMLGNN
ncbi:RNHCP domain-containing protein [Candidatus Kaiserbacteria bacterium]|nr:RNHCP domain-containing protein [Candidatus Kaiserbacteria bacterium]